MENEDALVLKSKFMFLFVCLLIGIGIYTSSGTPSKDINPGELRLKNIEQIEIINISNEKNISLKDSNQMRPIIEQLLVSKKREIRNPTTFPARLRYSLKITLKNKELLRRFDFYTYPNGNFFNGYNYSHTNDSLFILIDSLKFE
jgi:hypothetical protein